MVAEEVVCMADDDEEDTAGVSDEHQAARERARAGLVFVLPDRPYLPPTKARKSATTEHTPTEMRRQNTERQRKGGGKETDQDEQSLTKADKHKVDPRSRHEATRDVLLDRVALHVPVYVTLTALCKAEDGRRGLFIEDYCRILQAYGRLGYAVSREELAQLAARPEHGFHVRTAYRRLRWAYALFSTWAYQQYRVGHIFTPEELAPMARWIEAMNQGGYDQEGDECG